MFPQPCLYLGNGGLLPRRPPHQLSTPLQRVVAARAWQTLWFQSESPFIQKTDFNRERKVDAVWGQVEEGWEKMVRGRLVEDGGIAGEEEVRKGGVRRLVRNT